jgi:hypothetical protein
MRVHELTFDHQGIVAERFADPLVILGADQQPGTSAAPGSRGSESRDPEVLLD